MAETNTAAPAPTQADPKQTANNIVQGIKDKANGKAPAVPQGQEQKPPANPVSDPNAGKEKYVVDGREVWLTPEQARSYVQKGISFEPKMDQLARLAQEQIQFQNALIKDPGLVLANLAKQSNVPLADLVARVLKGNSAPEIKEVVGKWYYDEAVLPEKSPEEYAQRQKDRKLTEYEQKEKEYQERAVAQENQVRVAKAMAEIKSFIGEAMKESGLPSYDTPLGAEMARMVADRMRIARLNRQAITPKQAIEHVKQQIRSTQTAFYDFLDDEALVKELGEKNVDKIKKYLLKIAKSSGNPPNLPSGQRPTVRGERKTHNMDDFHDYLEERKKAG